MRENKSLGKDSIHRCFLAATFSFHVSGKETYIMLKLPNVMFGTYRCKPEMNRQKFCSGNKVAAMSLQETHWPTMALPGQAFACFPLQMLQVMLLERKGTKSFLSSQHLFWDIGNIDNLNLNMVFGQEI